MTRTKYSVALPEGVEDDRKLQRKVWAVQRLSWLIFALLLFLSLLGVFGSGGYFSRQTVAFPGGSVDVPVTARWPAPEELKVTFSPSADDRTFLVDARFHETFAIDSVDPAAGSVLSRGGRTLYVFPASPAHAVTVAFRLKTQRPGIRSYLLGIGEDVLERTVVLFP
ncbi:hypothetical protein [Mycoplana dimorpha]|uniref:Uncharacterized protein n=1 Tax=Mycoplana dimorpha TaxID=28320 RepID=A0A2T5B5C3_MYCDI|nr:hypothetical protein [Mycoplana dimorpha]PTM94162.1 hypothetical protein C7449_10561 [Mycoplana dimorpha]